MGTWIYFQISQFSHAFQFSAWSWCCVLSSTKWNSFINNYSGDSSKWDYRNSNGLRHLLKTGIGCQVLKIESLARLSMASRSLPLVRTSQSHAFHWLSRLLQAPVFVFKMPHACCIKCHSLLEWVSGSEDACLNIQYSCRGYTIFQLLPTKHCTLHAYGASVISFAVQYLPTYGVSPWRRVSPILPIMLRESWEAEGPVLPLPSHTLEPPPTPQCCWTGPRGVDVRVAHTASLLIRKQLQASKSSQSTEQELWMWESAPN